MKATLENVREIKPMDPSSTEWHVKVSDRTCLNPAIWTRVSFCSSDVLVVGNKTKSLICCVKMKASLCLMDGEMQIWS